MTRDSQGSVAAARLLGDQDGELPQVPAVRWLVASWSHSAWWTRLCFNKSDTNSSMCGSFAPTRGSRQKKSHPRTPFYSTLPTDDASGRSSSCPTWYSSGLLHTLKITLFIPEETTSGPVSIDYLLRFFFLPSVSYLIGVFM